MPDVALAPFRSPAFDRWRHDEIARRADHIHAPMSGSHDGALAVAERSVQGLLPYGPSGPSSTLLRITLADADVGWVWLQHPVGQAPVVLDAELRGDVRPGALARCLGVWASERGDEQVLADRFGPRSVLHALTAGWTVEAANLALPLAETTTSADSLETHLQTSVEAYARAMHAGATITWEAALTASRETHAALLPDGVHSPGQYLLDAVVAGSRVGMIWIAQAGAFAGFVYDIVVDEALRGHGHGRQTMAAAALWCREQGMRVLGLNVFGDNVPARALYDSLGMPS